MKDLSPLDTYITLQRVGNPSTEEVWQQLRAAQAELPQIQEYWHQAYLTSQEQPTQVEQHEPSSHDIKLDLVVARSYKTNIILERRGERNIPTRFLKNTHWDAHNNSDGTIDLGYYAQDPDGNYHTVNFDFNSLTWGTIYLRSNRKCHLTIPASIKLGLRIFDEERTIPHSDWGEINSRNKDNSDNPDEQSDEEDQP